VLGLVGVVLAGLAVRAIHSLWAERQLRERIAAEYVETGCTVLASDVRTEQHSGRAHGSDQHRDIHATFAPLVRYRYRVSDRSYESERFAADPPLEHERARVDVLLRAYPAGGGVPVLVRPA
jgi:hypothetical protein